MDNEELGYEPCRLCGASTDLLVPIASGEGLELKLEAKVTNHLPIEFSPKDQLPQAVCYPCVEHLLAWDSFVSRCVDVDAKHRLFFSEKSEVEEVAAFSDSDNEPLKKIQKFDPGDCKERFVCEKCGREFERKRSLTSHSRACKAAGSFECDLCHNVYKTKVNLKKHKEREHKTDQVWLIIEKKK